MRKSNNDLYKTQNIVESFKERILILFEELASAIKWQRPSILLAVYTSEFVRKKAENALEHRLLKLKQNVCKFQVDEDQYDVPLLIAQLPDRNCTVFFISGINWGGGRANRNAYRALNNRREYLVDNQIRAIFWLTEKEANNLPHLAPDFWAFRHRVVEFTDRPILKRNVIIEEELIWREWNPRFLREGVNKKIAHLEKILSEKSELKKTGVIRIELFYDLASLYWVKSDYKRAIDLLKRGLGIAKRLKAKDKYSQFWVGLGLAFHLQGDTQESVKAYKKAMKLDSQNAGPWNNLGNIYHNLIRVEDAMRAYQTAIDLEPAAAGPWNNLGNLYRSLGRIEDAIDAYRKTIELDPKDERPWKNLAIVYQNQGRLKDSLCAYKMTIKLDPMNARQYISLGNIYRSLERVSDAVRAYKKAVKLDPANQTYQSILTSYNQIIDKKSDSMRKN